MPLATLLSLEAMCWNDYCPICCRFSKQKGCLFVRVGQKPPPGGQTPANNGEAPHFEEFAEPVLDEGEVLVQALAAGLHPIVKTRAAGSHP